MGTIVERRRKTGGTAFMAKIILKRDGRIIHRESRTLETRTAAKNWMRDREYELSRPAEIARMTSPAIPTLADAIERYLEDTPHLAKTGRSYLSRIAGMEIGRKPCDRIVSADIVDMARTLTETIAPQTVHNYVAYLSSVFRLARPAWSMPLSYDEIKGAWVVLRRMRLVASSNSRDRRPTLEELDRMLEFFERQALLRIPMVKIVAFAIFSTRRRDEITRMRWIDYEPQHKRVLIRQMKDPRKKIDVWVDLPDEAMAIIATMPKVAPEIFPFRGASIGTAFAAATEMLGIEDLHFHDLRHEGISRLFEMGLNIPNVALVSGHRSWSSLSRYTHIRQQGDKYADWPWLKKITVPE